MKRILTVSIAVLSALGVVFIFVYDWKKRTGETEKRNQILAKAREAKAIKNISESMESEIPIPSNN